MNLIDLIQFAEEYSQLRERIKNVLARLVTEPTAAAEFDYEDLNEVHKFLSRWTGLVDVELSNSMDGLINYLEGLE